MSQEKLIGINGESLLLAWLYSRTWVNKIYRLLNEYLKLNS